MTVVLISHPEHVKCNHFEKMNTLKVRKLLHTKELQQKLRYSELPVLILHPSTPQQQLLQGDQCFQFLQYEEKQQMKTKPQTKPAASVDTLLGYDINVPSDDFAFLDDDGHSTFMGDQLSNLGAVQSVTQSIPVSGRGKSAGMMERFDELKQEYDKLNQEAMASRI